MSSMLPDALRVVTRQNPRGPDQVSAARFEQLLVLLPAHAPRRLWSALPAGTALARAAARAPRRRVPAAVARVDNAPATAVAVAAVDPAAARFRQLETARRLAEHALGENPARIGIAAVGFDEDTRKALLEALLLALQAGSFALPRYGGRAEPRTPPQELEVLGAEPALKLRRLEAAVEGNNLARWLTAMPPNRLDAPTYRRAAKRLADTNGWSMRFLDERALKRAGAGAFLAVSQANAKRDAGIIHLRYRPRRASRARPALTLVGKGILFDTGGNNLKGFQSMRDMHMDMAGSATALGTLLALTRLRVPYAVDCWLPITENRIGPEAYKTRDVVTACDGTTIEVVHTDAEGRMVLADTLALAGRDEPQVILDYATLTGTCVNALTDRYSGVFTNRPGLHELLVRTGRDCGERVWPFPLDDDYDDMLESETADIRQCAEAGQGDHILAARFLSRFVPESSAWVHMDMAAGFRKDGLGFVSTQATGFGVIYSVALLSAQTDGPTALAAQANA